MLGGMSRSGILLAALAVLGSTLLSGCVAGDPVAIGPTGVDELEIPTPSPDPDDFVADVDNPLLPLVPGNRWRYESTSGATTEVAVTSDPRTIGGLTATTVETVVTATDGSVQETSEWYAQDTAGNVWLLGQDGPDAAWEAGVDGAQAGIAMLAEPRVGDGYRQQLAEGVAEDRVTVLSVDEAVNVTAGSYADVVQVEVTTPLGPGQTQRRYYAAGVGLVFAETIAGGSHRLDLVDVSEG
jgi:hypothetical protein